MKYLLLFISSFVFAQQTQFVDFVSVSGQLTLNPNEKMISGAVNYNFTVLKSIDTIKIDAQNMTFSDLKINGNEIKFLNTGKQLQLIYPFKKGKNKLSFTYFAKPKQTLYFVDSYDSSKPEAMDKQIWTQGQGRYTSHWFPSFDDVNEKVTFSLAISYDAKYQVISNGVLKRKVKNSNTIFWEYQMQKPMSSYLLMLAVGQFEKQTQKSKSGIPLEMYLENKDATNFEPTYRYSVKMFDFLEKEIGVKYPWKIYKQAPVRDFLYAGMENTSATLFSTRYVVDSTGFEDRSYTNVNAHELAHQWFGDLVTAESGKHHWLQEGFATYYAMLAEKEIYGEDYFYFKLYESAQQLKYASRTDTIPVLNPKASSLTFYQKGAWALHVLREAIGEKAFNKAVNKYLKKHAYHSVNTHDFFQEIKKLSNFDLDQFSKVWLETSVFNTMHANSLLSKNKSIQILLEIEKLKSKPLAIKKDYFVELLQSEVYFTLKQAIVNQLKNEKFEDKKALLELALNTENLQVRQTVATTMSVIPEEFKTQYESLLYDRSYQTQEIALYNLWNNFPDSRTTYLDSTKHWIGFNDYNLRSLWLSLAISTPTYLTNKESLIKELTRYSSTKYEANIRQDALEKLIAFKLINDEVLHNLVNATTHHMWQFSKYGRDTIRILLKTTAMRSSFERILTVLNENEQFQLNRLLKE